MLYNAYDDFFLSKWTSQGRMDIVIFREARIFHGDIPFTMTRCQNSIKGPWVLWIVIGAKPEN